MNSNSSSNPLPPLLDDAVSAHKRGDADAALARYEKFLETSPQHPDALQLCGLLHSERGEYQQAIALMRASLKLAPLQAQVNNNLGNALSAAGEQEQAMAAYQRALELEPGYTDAWRNLGLCCLDNAALDDAEKALKRCLELEADDAAACMGLGIVFQNRADYERAIHFYERALRIRPDYAAARHNLGVCLRVNRKPETAIEHFHHAIRLGLDRAENYQNLASARVDTGDIDAAIDAYREAIIRDPEDTVSHKNLNKLLWEHERLDEHLESYRNALGLCPGSVPLVHAYGLDLYHLGHYQEAEEILVKALESAPVSAEILSLLAHVYEGQGDWDRAIELHSEAVNMPGAIADQRVSLARALLARQRPEEALRHAELAARETPFNQRAIAYLGLCWRLLDNNADAFINDYQSFIRVYDVPVPEQFRDAAEFNQRLATLLATLHLSKRHPPEQTLHGGTQTYGNLFDRRQPEIRQLQAGITACVADYIDKLDHHDSHPLLMRRSEHFEFYASWSVRLQESGYHNMHIHPLGWISSAYYVEVPTEVSQSQAQEGVLKFGEPDIDLGWRGMATRKIRPAVGQLVLFPSYMWHGTVPFRSKQPRTTVAFDVVPVHNV